VESVGWETDAVLIRSTVWAFERTDQVVAAAFEAVDYAVGAAIGFSLGARLPVLVPLALVTGLLGYAAYLRLPPHLQREAREAAGVGGDALQRWLADHPEIVEHLANGGGGLVDGFWTGLTHQPVFGPDGAPPFHPTTEEAAALLASLYPGDGSPVVVPRQDLASPAATVPASLEAMIAHLRRVALLSGHPDSPDNGTVEIQTWEGPRGPQHIVYVPGTDDMLTTPLSRDHDVRDMPTNLLAVSGAGTTYAQGILEAMEQGGIAPGEPVTLVGHSQGGIMAAWLAAHQETYEVTNVVTAGSPVGGQGPYPPETHLLSLENKGDLIPMTEGEQNPDAANHVTVTFDADGPDLVGNHDLERYVAGGGAVDASAHPSLVAELERLRALGFLAGPDAPGTGTRTQVFQITRDQR
jgi:hypothetical protein